MYKQKLVVGKIHENIANARNIKLTGIYRKIYIVGKTLQ